MKTTTLFKLFFGLTLLPNPGGWCQTPTNSNTISKQTPDSLVIINSGVRFQTIANFGASDAWSCQFVGNWPEQPKNQVADWLFSTENDQNGQPKGIGLSLWRFNIGAGSSERKNIRDDWRAAETFSDTMGRYDWTKQKGQQWFLQAAQKRGVPQFLAFTNSPPAYLTTNQKAFSGNGKQANISSDHYLSYATFLLDIIAHFQQKEKIPFQYLSPFNEPQWDWTENNQEGCPYTNDEIYHITRILDSLITVRKLPVKVIIGEAGKLNYLFETADRPGRGAQISDFFNHSSSHYLGNLPNVVKAISGHSYFTTAPISSRIQVREHLFREMLNASVPLQFWQSEYCLLGDQEEVKPSGKDLGMETGLYVAGILHHDLTVANASAWQWWLALSPYDYKDGLIYVSKDKTTGKAEASKLMWTLGNFSRFIRPGSVRVEALSKTININNPEGLMISSYLNEKNKDLMVVIINKSKTKSRLKLKIQGKPVKLFIPYLTDDIAEKGLIPLPAINPENTFDVPGRSVMTLVGQLKNE